MVLGGFCLRMVGVDMSPQTVLISERFMAVRTSGLLLLGVTDFQVFLQVGAVADGLMAHWAGSGFVRVVL